MSERLPYEEQLPHQWDALPLPDENLAWADMKRRLEEEDDSRPVAWWRRGCMLWGFLLLALLGTGWWLLRPDRWFDKKKNSDSITRLENKENTNTDLVNTIDTTGGVQEKKEEPTGEEIAKNQDGPDSVSQIAVDKTVIPAKEKNDIDQLIKTKKEKSGTTKIKVKNVHKDQKEKNRSPQVKDPKKEEVDETFKTDPVIKDNSKPVSSDSTNRPIKTTDRTDTQIAVAKKDTVITTSVKTDSAVVNNTTKKDTAKKKQPLYFSAGIALHQQLPVAGQKFTPYNALGRKGSLADYIPSIYFRLNKKDKWFLQAEFRYGAPQYNKDLVYDQQSVIDTGQTPVFTTITTTRLKKTFYHQLPLTFNYYITKNWALGGGIQWNKFSSAVTEQEINKRRNATQQDSIIGKPIIVQKGDSAYQFTKSYFLGVVETEYKWKRFSLGARYTVGLQPYIKFSLPGAPAQQQRSSSLQLFLRYQLWRSKDR